MNEVSIIINGVRYDAVKAPEPKKGDSICGNCDLCELYSIPCSELIGDDKVFKKSDKKFEK